MASVFQKQFGMGAVLDYNSKNAVRNMGLASRAAFGLRKSFTGMASGATKIAGGIGKLTIAMAPLTLAMGLGVKEAIAFETGMARIGTLVPDVDLKPLAKDLDAMTQAFGLSAATMQEAAFQAISASVPLEKTAEFMELASKAAVGGFTDVNVAVDGLTNTLNAYGLGIEHATAVSDSFFVANKLGKTTFEALARTLGRVAPIAAKMGVSFQDLGATVATATKRGISTAETVTGLKAALTAVLKPTDKAAKVAERLGLAFGPDAIKSAGGFLPFLQKLTDATGGSAESLGQLFPQVRGLNAVLSLTTKQGLKDFQQAIEEMGAGGQTQKAFETVAATAQHQFNRTKQIMLSIVRSMGAAVLPLINETLQPIGAALQSLASDPSLLKGFQDAAKEIGATLREYVLPAIRYLRDAWDGLSKDTKAGIAKAIMVAGALGAAIGAIGAAAVPVAFALSGLGSIASGVGSVIGAIFSPQALAIIAVGAAAIAVVAENWDRVKIAAMEFAEGFMSVIVPVWNDFKSQAMPALMQVWDALKGIFETIIVEGDSSSSTWKELGATAAAALGGIAAVLSVVAKAFAATFSFITEQVIKPWIRSWKRIVGGVLDILTGKDVLGGLAKIFRGLAGSVLAPYRWLLKQMFQLTSDAIRQVVLMLDKLPGFTGSRFDVSTPLALAGMGAERFGEGLDEFLGGKADETPFRSGGIPGTEDAEIAERKAQQYEEARAKSVADALSKAKEVPPEVNVNVNTPAPIVSLDSRDLSKGIGRTAARDSERGATGGRQFSPSQRMRVLRGNLIQSERFGRGAA